MSPGLSQARESLPTFPKLDYFCEVHHKILVFSNSSSLDKSTRRLLLYSCTLQTERTLTYISEHIRIVIFVRILDPYKGSTNTTSRHSLVDDFVVKATWDYNRRITKSTL